MIGDFWSVNTLADIQFTLHRHLSQQLTNFWLMHTCMGQSTLGWLSTNCWSSVDWVLTKYWSGCWLRTNQSLNPRLSTQDVIWRYLSTLDRGCLLCTWSKMITRQHIYLVAQGLNVFGFHCPPSVVHSIPSSFSTMSPTLSIAVHLGVSSVPSWFVRCVSKLAHCRLSNIRNM